MKNFFKAMAVSATVAISAPAEAAPVDVDIMFVIDHSGSMSSAFTSLAADITAFVNGLAGSADVSSLATGVVTYEAARNGANTTCGSSAAQSCLAVKQGCLAVDPLIPVCLGGRHTSGHGEY